MITLIFINEFNSNNIKKVLIWHLLEFINGGENAFCTTKAATLNTKVMFPRCF